MSDLVKLGVIHFNYLSEDIPAYLSCVQELLYYHGMSFCYSTRIVSSEFPTERCWFRSIFIVHALYFVSTTAASEAEGFTGSL